MKSGSFVSENPLGGDNVQSFPATPARGADASMSSEEGSQLVEMSDGNNTGALRSTVAGRVMGMLRAHDRARLEVLTIHPTNAR